ncbi:CHRD domain-containing protein [Janthinobacterium aquaticum]|uniref:CHRD domain-containing protein n=1 Tax=Janthinobacterium sp. FT58W TaxID=2654254 RepID=UPI00186AD753|nr:CHRD domain-containing protein [Janthinobacterium sp. FT58W]
MVVVALLGGCAQRAPHDQDVTLSGAQCVPANSSAASASSSLRVLPDGRVTGSVRHTGMLATGAQLHAALAGANGPTIVTLQRTGEGSFAAPPDARLTPLQYALYQAGGVYVNIQSAAYPAGEIRAQLKP